MGVKILNEAGNKYKLQPVTLPTLKQRHLAKLREALVTLKVSESTQDYPGHLLVKS